MQGFKCWVFSTCCCITVLLAIIIILGFICHAMEAWRTEHVCEYGWHEVEQQMAYDRMKGDHCPWGWKTLGESCYFYKNNAMTWHNAEEFCQMKGGHLVSIHSPGEDCFVRRMIEMDNTHLDHYLPEVWLGFTDEGHEGYFTWTDNSIAGYTQWGHSEPNQYMGLPENCGSLMWLGYGYVWNDATCDAYHGLICKASKRTLLERGY